MRRLEKLLETPTRVSNQLHSEETDTLQQRCEWWMVVLDSGDPTPNDVYDCSFAELFNLYCKVIDPEMQSLVKTLKDR